MPAAAQELVIVVEDRDAPLPRPLEVVTMRLPSPLLDRARKDSEERGRPFAHSVRAALEIFFFHNVAREMAQTMTDDMKDLGLTREDYFRSLLDARYRQLIAKQVLAGAKKGSSIKSTLSR